MNTSNAHETSPRKSAYLLPNILTSMCLFSGFYAIVAAIKGNFMGAAEAILIAAVFDGLDGRVARLTKTTSRFGVEYDSLSDMVSFGVAPAIIGLLWGLQSYGRLGWLAAFLYAACTALRLARFNTLSQSGTISKAYFLGLPCPAAAVMMATTIFFFDFLQITGPVKNPWVLTMTYLLAFLMVSNIRYFSFKEAGWFQKHPFSAIVAVLVVMTVAAVEPKVTIFCVMLFYVVSGPILLPFKSLRKKAETNVTNSERSNTPETSSRDNV